MKTCKIRIIFTLFISILIPNAIYAQKVQLNEKEINCIKAEQNQIKIRLDSALVDDAILSFPVNIWNCIDSLEYITNNYLNLGVRLLYNQEMQDRILDLLNNKWQEWEIEMMVNRYVEYKRSFLNDAKKIQKQDTNKTYSQVLDSLKKSYAKELENKYRNNFPSDYESFVEVASYISNPHYIEPIKKNLSRNPSFYSICLARMGNEPYLTNEMEKLKQYLKEKDYKKVNDIVFSTIRTQESFKILSEVLLTKETYNPYSEGNYTHPYYRLAMETICTLLANEEVRELFSEEDRQKSIFYPMIRFSPYFTEKHAKRLYDWMQKNYGKYKIRPF